MVSTAWIILGTALFLGISFASGFFLGRMVSWGRVSAVLLKDEKSPQLLKFVRRLDRMIDQLSRNVGAHQTQIEAASSVLVENRGHLSKNITDFVVRVVEKILESNELLQSRLQSAEAKLQEQRGQLDTYLTKAQTDSLTRLPNRRVFDEQLRMCIDEYDYNQTAFALLMIDVDRFKAINDGFGHPGGDYVLRELAAAIAGSAGEGSFVSRLGGEEFAVLAVCEAPEEAFRLAEKIRLAVAEHYFSYEGVALAVTLSLGVALIGQGESGSDLLSRTDRALYAAKAAGRNRSFYHNGKTCQPINLPKPPKDENEGLLELCDDLRQRMAEIVKD
jgi:diguanylate cyclase